MPFTKEESIFTEEVSKKIEDAEKFGDFDISELDINMISSDKFMLDPPEDAIFEDEANVVERRSFLSKRMLLAALTGTVVFLSVCAFFIADRHTGKSSDDIEELPIIKAEVGPLKEMAQPKTLERDKKIYTYITNEKDGDDLDVKAVSSEVKLNDIKSSLPSYEDDVLESPEENSEDSQYIEPSKSNAAGISKEYRLGKQKAKRYSINENIDQLIGEDQTAGEKSKNGKSGKKKPLKDFFKRKPHVVPVNKSHSKFLRTDTGVFICSRDFQTKKAALNAYYSAAMTHDSISDYGYKIEKSKTPNDNTYHIMIGPFENEKEASKAEEIVRQAGID